MLPDKLRSSINLPWLFYAMGFLGLFAFNSALMSVIIYRYDPGPNAAQLPVLVPAAIVGVVLFLGRVISAVSQPLTGYFSDRLQGRWGKRRPFLAIGTVPMIASFVLLFYPIVTPESPGNGIYLLSLLGIFYVAFSLYKVPYLAWLPELAPQDRQRVALSGWLAVSSLVGTIGGGAGSLWLSARYGFGVMTAAIGSVGFVTLLLPLLAPESASKRSEQLPLLLAIRSSWHNLAFRSYVLSISAGWIVMTILSVCATFFTVALLDRDVGFTALVNILVLGGAAGGMVGVAPIAKRLGKKRTFQLSMLWSGGGLLLLSAVQVWIGPSLLLWLILLPLGSLGLAGFLVLPNAMLPDVVERDRQLGRSAQAIYFGSRGLFVELSTGIGALIVGLLLSFGKSAAQPLGVLLSLIAAGLFALLSAGFLTKYPIGK